jgi:hypothetical protein
MSRLRIIPSVIAVSFATGLARADLVMPQAPASVSWLPHRYGGNMRVPNTVSTREKGLHGFRTVPAYIGSWSQTLWGWDVNGYFLGPNVPSPDPGLNNFLDRINVLRSIKRHSECYFSVVRFSDAILGYHCDEGGVVVLLSCCRV